MGMIGLIASRAEGRGIAQGRTEIWAMEKLEDPWSGGVPDSDEWNMFRLG